MVTKAEVEAKAASTKIYDEYAPKIAAVEGVEKKVLTDEAHEKAIAAAQARCPNINITSVKNQLGGKVRTWKDKLKEKASASKKPDNGGSATDETVTIESGDGSGGNVEPAVENPLLIDPAVQKYIDEKLAAATVKPDTGGVESIKVPHEPPDPRMVKAASQLVADKVVAQFDAIIEKIYLDDYRKALFASYKAMVGYEGDLGDFIIEAFDLFFKIKGVDLVIQTTRPIKIEDGMIKSG